MILAVPKETYPGERRVALVPSAVPPLIKAGFTVLVEQDAGTAASCLDTDFKDKGAEIVPSRSDLFARADVILQVRSPGANPEAGAADIAMLREGQIVIGLTEPFTDPAISKAVAETGAVLFSMELIPRITRAQSMDALSSMATLAGYQAVLLAAGNLPKMFPMMMTAAGTIAPAKVFIVGVGVAGLMAIAQARKLGAVVEAYDVRPAVKEQVQSLGAKFVEMELEADDAEDKGGYAKAMDEDFYRKQRELMTRVVAANDVVITTAAIPGRAAPILVTEEMVKGMAPGSVIVDLAAVGGGNCELTRPDEVVEAHGVKIFGPTDLPSQMCIDASRMYAKNISALLLNMAEDGRVDIDKDDEVVAGTMVTRDGKVVHPMILEKLEETA
ncbi:Re/Si-specific NAD(P)(+) transhydrogenase subunit alpha [Desulfovibrio ferrophilus]|uniref:NAD(P) transhydrogenase subunit alpha part 1 n=1 Tax=Desulfovibrio ferrophilus TaxID=241368 RepID=A0A2Z6AUY6_9BACT|nr:Re/Si-specific NAD(P)(+) transhydrogenase subunit alpha [Desulfovibrio ferrophilus]BBD07047.1 NAD(P) transhydrogenase alpha subunit [Desulfovibrio ferrophilus]